MDRKDLRVELKTRNNRLWHAIFDYYPSVAGFCRTHGLSNTEIGHYLNLTKSPYLVDRVGFTKQALKAASVCGELTEDLFPPDLYSGRFSVRLTAEVESSRFVGLEAARALELPPSQFDDVARSETSGRIVTALAMLRKRDAEVIRMRYGLAGDDEMTCEEVGKKLGVTGSRVRQIELAALRKLRHRSAKRIIAPSLYDLIPGGDRLIDLPEA